jgi:hypothetical protein
MGPEIADDGTESNLRQPPAGLELPQTHDIFLGVSNRGKESAMPGKHTSHVKDSDKYEALRRKGMSKTRAAKISNAGKSVEKKGAGTAIRASGKVGRTLSAGKPDAGFGVA